MARMANSLFTHPVVQQLILSYKVFKILSVMAVVNSFNICSYTVQGKTTNSVFQPDETFDKIKDETCHETNWYTGITTEQSVSYDFFRRRDKKHNSGSHLKM